MGITKTRGLSKRNLNEYRKYVIGIREMPQIEANLSLEMFKCTSFEGSSSFIYNHIIRTGRITQIFGRQQNILKCK